MAATTLYDYFTGKGQSLPSIMERSKLYESYGLGSASTYTGTERQNAILLGKLTTAPQVQAPSAPTTSATSAFGGLGMDNDQFLINRPSVQPSPPPMIPTAPVAPTQPVPSTRTVQQPTYRQFTNANGTIVYERTNPDGTMDQQTIPFQTPAQPTGIVTPQIPTQSTGTQNMLEGIKQSLTKLQQMTKEQIGATTPTSGAVPSATGVTSAPSTPATTPTTAPAVTSVTSLQTNATITALEKKMQEQLAQLVSGISSGGAVDILKSAFKEYGVEEDRGIVNDYNALIVEKQQRLRKIPDEIKDRLDEIGVSATQLNSLIEHETQKPLEMLRDLMELRGVAQDRINQSLKFVGLFADAAMQDKAAKIEGAKYDFENNKDLLKRLDDKQQDLVKLALEDQKTILTVANNATQNGGTSDQITDIIASASPQEAMQKVAKYGLGAKPDTSADTVTTTETDAQGNVTTVTLDKKTGQIISKVDLGRIGKPQVAEGKPATAAQEKLSGYAVRVEQAETTIQKTQEAIVKMRLVSFMAQINLPAALQTPIMQQYMQAGRNFYNAVLRQESGAVISPTEFAEARQQYLPQPGDVQEVLNQKLLNRKAIKESYKKAAGPAYSSVEELLGIDNIPELPKSAAEAEIGAEFTGSDGQRYRKVSDTDVELVQ